jgi:ATP-binding cassette subfamily B protein/subfamily B ATP-binding cassette protein MsbA
MARRLYPYIRKQKGRLIMALIFGLGYTVAGIVQPWTMKLILDNVVLQQPLPGFLEMVLPSPAVDRIPLLNILVIAVILLAGARGLLYYYQKLLAARVGQQATADIRLHLYSHLQHLSFTFHDRRRTGDLLTRLTSDTRFLREIFVSLPLSISSELFLVAGMLVVMLLMDWSLTLIALTVLPAIALVLRVYQRPMKQAIRRQRDREGDIATIASEALGAIKVVQGFRREDHEVGRFTVENKRSLRTGMKAARLEAKLRWLAELTVAVVTAVVLAVAVRRVMAGGLSPGDLIVFVSYLRTFNRPLRRISSMAERAARGTAAGDRILEMLELEPTVKDLPGARRAPRLRGEIVFESVFFKHRKGPMVLKGLDLRIRPGEKVALVGPTGCGKTTMASLIPRFYDPLRGTIQIDGVDIRDMKLASLRDQIALVFQEPVLFATTVAENISYGKPGAGEEDIVHAAKEAGIHHVMASLSEGYQTVLGERGGTLSGGQRQCVSIARAMIKDAPIVILDEPTTGLDEDSSKMVVGALDRLMEGRTVIMITHRRETLRGMDRVLVLEDGRVREEEQPARLIPKKVLCEASGSTESGEPTL